MTDRTIPLAERMRPDSLEKIVGQKHLLAPGKPIYQMYQKRSLFSMVLWGPPGSGKGRRLADQVEFLCATERQFNEEIIRYLREDLKCKQLILPGNWRPANPVTMQDAQRLTHSMDFERKLMFDN